MTPKRHRYGEHGADEGYGGRPEATEDEEQQQDQERQGEEFGLAQVLRGDRGDLDVGDRGPPEPGIALQDGWAAMARWRAVTACFSCTAPTVATTTVSSPPLEIMAGSPVLA